MFEHILVPTDGSELSVNAARAAVSFARETGARITVFYAKPKHPLPHYEEAVIFNDVMRERFANISEEAAQEILGAVENLCKQAGVACTKLAQFSDMPYEAIIESATQSGCDLIFMASHGRRGINALLLGSETNKVLTHSKIPVLVYR